MQVADCVLAMAAWQLFVAMRFDLYVFRYEKKSDSNFHKQKTAIFNWKYPKWHISHVR